MKKYLTVSNVVVGLLLIGITMQVIVIFFPSHRNNDKLDLLEQQQVQLQQIADQLQKNDDENKKRDSVLLDAFQQNNASREIQLSKTKTSANEKINHINSGVFTADSIKRYFANN